MLKVFISASGHVNKAEISGSSRHPRLDNAALDTVKNWIFYPAMEDGIPKELSLSVPVHWRLRGFDESLKPDIVPAYP